MRVLVATDAWHPQVNGVVRTLDVARAPRGNLGADDRFPFAGRFSVVSGSDLSGPAARAAEPARIAARIDRRARTPSTSRPKDRSDLRCAPIAARRGRPFTTSYTTRFPEYISARSPIPRGMDLCGAAPLPWRGGRDDGGDALADERAARARLHAISACGRAASTPICSVPTAPSISICAARSSCPSAASRSRRTWRRSCRSICRAPRSSSATARRGEAQAQFPAGEVPRSSWTTAAGRASRGGGRLRLPEPHRHVRHRAARGAGQRRSGCRFSGHRPEGRDRRAARSGFWTTTCGRACLDALRLSRNACRTFALDFSWENSARQFLGHVRPGGLPEQPRSSNMRDDRYRWPRRALRPARRYRFYQTKDRA